MFNHLSKRLTTAKASKLIMATATLTLMGGCGGHTTGHGSASAPEIEVSEVVTDSITLFKTYPGTVTAKNHVDLVPRASGYLTSIHFSGGDLVKQGQVLFSIEDTQYRNAVQEARGQLATAKSNLEYARTHYKAMAKALESDAVAQIEVAQAKNALDESEAAVAIAQATLQTAITNLSYCTITAPLTGHITTAGPSKGAYLNANSGEVLATIYEDERMNANFYIEDDAVIKMFTNENGRDRLDYSAIPVNFSDSLPHRYTGDLTYMSPNVDQSTGTLKLQATIMNPYGELRNGMYATISLPYKFMTDAMLVRDSSIGTNQLGKYLYVVNDSNEVVYTPVKVGDLYGDTLRVVISGVTPGMRYVSKALLNVREGMKVTPVTAPLTKEKK